MKKAIWVSLSIIPVILLIFGYLFPSSFFLNQESIRSFITSFGMWAAVIFVLINILQVILTPMSHYVVGIVGGFVFGLWWGFLLNWIGRIIGTAIVFFLGRIFGRKIIKHVVKPKTLKKYDTLFEKGKWAVFLMYFLPLFPDDELSYLAGFSKIKPRVFLPLMVVGHISGSLSLAYFGVGLSLLAWPFILILATTFLGGLALLFIKK